MKMLSALFFILFSAPVFAASPEAEQACMAKIDAAVHAVAKDQLGVKEEFGVEISATGRVVHTHLGETLVEYATTPFFISDGYISGSGATARVLFTDTGCELKYLSVHSE